MLDACRAMRAGQGVQIVYGTGIRNARRKEFGMDEARTAAADLDFKIRRYEAAEARLFVDVECMILMLVDAHGGEVRTAQLVQLFRRHYGKELDFKGLGYQTLSKFLMRLPGVSVVHLPGDSKTS